MYVTADVTPLLPPSYPPITFVFATVCSISKAQQIAKHFPSRESLNRD